MTDQTSIEWLQDFYKSMCNGDWEHGSGFSISTLDNPGWALKFDLQDSFLEAKPYAPLSFERSDNDWVHCKVEERQWRGFGGTHNLDELIGHFRDWAEAELHRQRI